MSNLVAYTVFRLWTIGTNQLALKFRERTVKLCGSGRSGTTIIDPENVVLLAVKRLYLAKADLVSTKRRFIRRPITSSMKIRRQHLGHVLHCELALDALMMAV